MTLMTNTLMTNKFNDNDYEHANDKHTNDHHTPAGVDGPGPAAGPCARVGAGDGRLRTGATADQHTNDQHNNDQHTNDQHINDHASNYQHTNYRHTVLEWAREMDGCVQKLLLTLLALLHCEYR
jgi:hypothetical protein